MRLHILPTSIGALDNTQHIPESAKDAMGNLKYFFCEHEKTARRWLRSFLKSFTQEDLRFCILHKLEDPLAIGAFFAEAKMEGVDVGLLSDAGVPGIADPGREVVQYAHRLQITVVPYVGPSSILLAHMASGFSGQEFSFCGYLPRDKQALSQRILDLERKTAIAPQSFIETPYRNKSIFDTLLLILQPSTMLCVAEGLLTEKQSIVSASIKEWKGRPNKTWDKTVPAIFILGRS